MLSFRVLRLPFVAVFFPRLSVWFWLSALWWFFVGLWLWVLLVVCFGVVGLLLCLWLSPVSPVLGSAVFAVVSCVVLWWCFLFSPLSFFRSALSDCGFSSAPFLVSRRSGAVLCFWWCSSWRCLS